MSDVCRCGHDRDSHYRRRGSCMHSTPALVWACSCVEWHKPHWWAVLLDRFISRVTKAFSW